MAGTTLKRMEHFGLPESPVRDLIIQLNTLIDDVEKVRAAEVGFFNYKVENLAADGDITERGFFQHTSAITIVGARIIPEANSAGVDGSNTAVIKLRNITEGADVAAVTRTADITANVPVALTLNSSNVDIAASDVLGIVVTNGSNADLNTFVIQFSYQLQTVDAAADLTAAKIGNPSGTAISA